MLKSRRLKIQPWVKPVLKLRGFDARPPPSSPLEALSHICLSPQLHMWVLILSSFVLLDTRGGAMMLNAELESVNSIPTSLPSLSFT